MTLREETLAMTNEVQINRLAGSLGAELRGLNLASLSPAGLAIINKALLDHHVVAVRDQRVTPAELEAFARMLGAPHGYPKGLTSTIQHPEFPNIILLRNEGYARRVTQNWHSEGTAFSTPPTIPLLAAHILPSAGGDTGFANQ